MVSTPLKHISQNGNLSQIGLKIKTVWNHYLEYDKCSGHLKKNRLVEVFLMPGLSGKKNATVEHSPISPWLRAIVVWVCFAQQVHRNCSNFHQWKSTSVPVKLHQSEVWKIIVLLNSCKDIWVQFFQVPAVHLGIIPRLTCWNVPPELPRKANCHFTTPRPHAVAI